MIINLAKFELQKWFSTGKIWKFLALCQFMLGLIFYWLMQQYLAKTNSQFLENIQVYGITEEVIHPLFAWTALLFFVITPILTVNSFTEERKTHILALYLTSSLSPSDLVLGKFLGLLLTQLFLLLPTILMPLIISIHNTLDFGQFLSGILGLSLLLTANLCIAIFIANISKEPLTAAFVTFVSLLFLSLLEWMAKFLGPHFSEVSKLALLHHCQNFLSGLIHTEDVLYFLILPILFLYFSIKRLKQEPTWQRS